MREDYPKTQAEFDLWFASEQACREYVVRIRWPDGFICPRCKGGSAWIARRNRMVCAGCAYQASLTAGTIFQGTRKPLSMWLRAMWWVTEQKNGASALGLQQVLGLGHYGTAWTWLHKLRRAMVRPGRDRLGGTVEVDETYVGGKEKGARGRKLGNKALVAVAAEEAGAGTGRIRLKRVPDASAASLEAFILEAVEPGSAVRTDGWPSYSKLAARGYRHETRVTGGDPARTDREFPRVHRVASLLKRWLLGTHQGAVGHPYLDYYLDEFTFRFNRRASRSRGKLFYRLVQQAVATEPAPRHAMVASALASDPQRTPESLDSSAYSATTTYCGYWSQAHSPVLTILQLAV